MLIFVHVYANSKFNLPRQKIITAVDMNHAALKKKAICVL